MAGPLFDSPDERSGSSRQIHRLPFTDTSIPERVCSDVFFDKPPKSSRSNERSSREHDPNPGSNRSTHFNSRTHVKNYAFRSFLHSAFHGLLALQSKSKDIACVVLYRTWHLRTIQLFCLGCAQSRLIGISADACESGFRRSVRVDVAGVHGWDTFRSLQHRRNRFHRLDLGEHGRAERLQRFRSGRRHLPFMATDRKKDRARVRIERRWVETRVWS